MFFVPAGAFADVVAPVPGDFPTKNRIFKDVHDGRAAESVRPVGLGPHTVYRVGNRLAAHALVDVHIVDNPDILCFVFVDGQGGHFVDGGFGIPVGGVGRISAVLDGLA